MQLTEILIIILLISAIILCFALIYFHFKISKSVHSISLNLDEITNQVKPLVLSAAEFSNKISRISDEVENQIQTTKLILSKIKYQIDLITNVEEIIQNSIKENVTPIIRNVVAIGKGVKTFWKNYRSR